MDPESGYIPQYDSFKKLLLDMAQERSWETLLQLIGRRMLDIPHVVLVRLWLVRPGDICSTCPMRSICPDRTLCLHLVASAGHPISDAGEPTEVLEDDFRRIPLGVGKIGRIARDAINLRVEDMTKNSAKKASSAWAEKNSIRGFSGFPLVYRGEVLGVSAEFTRIPQPDEGEEQVWGRILADHMAAAIANARAFDELEKVTAEKERFESELQFAKLIQEGFLPEKPPKHSNFDFAAKMVPAKFVGGDFYDFIILKNNRLGIVFGDVSGKGVSAALYMARLLSDFRYISQMTPGPATTMETINKVLCQRSNQGMFATVVFLILDLNAEKIWIANAGHLPVLIHRAQLGKIEKLNAEAVPLGILPKAKFFSKEITLKKGDRLLLYTDGTVETYNQKMEHFGLKRMCDLLSETSHHSSTDLIAHLQNSIQKFAWKALPHDDLTLLTFKVV